jgi:CheY-like chemotaxis protein
MTLRPTVLVVDDDHDLRESVMELLEDHGYRAVGAVDGREALYLLHTAPAKPNVILLDLMMPVMDGLRFREEQLGDPEIAPIPVIVMTAHSRSPAPLLHASGFLHKPFPAGALLDLLASVQTPAARA